MPGVLRQLPSVANKLIAALALVLPAAAAGAPGGSITTLAGEMEGPVRFLAAGRLAVGGKAVPWRDVLLAVFGADGKGGSPARTFPPPHGLRLTNGELWRGRLVGMSGGKIRFELAGAREVSGERLWALDFVPRPPAGATAAGTLYRRKLKPLPGSLLWIDRTRIAVDSPLGALTVPRDGTVRYVLRPPAREALPAGQDEVHLIDGSILRGKLTAGPAKLKLDHAVLGEVTIPLPAVRALRRRPAKVAYLADLAPASAKTAPLVSASAEARVTAGAAPAEGPASRFVTRVRIEPQTVVRYRLSGTPAQKGGALAATLAAGEGARGRVVLRIRGGAKLLLEKVIDPGMKPVPVRLALPAGKELTFEADFGPRLRFPCAVVLGDPRLIGP